MKYFFLFLIGCLCAQHLWAQQGSLYAGPMTGHTELRTTQLWLQLKENVAPATVRIKYYTTGNAKETHSATASKDDNPFAHIYRFLINALEPGTSYTYQLFIKDKQTATGQFTTQPLWQGRQKPPDFSFIAGSCSYFNEAAYDRPGKPYGGDSSIYLLMAKEPASFMLWLGDNWYTREVDYHSGAGLHRRPATDRAQPILQPLLKAMPHYAIWDDHDYGPNNADKSYVLKEAARTAFQSFWANPSYGFNNEGIYTKFTWNDVDIFLLDDRWFRDNDDLKDSVNGAPNTNKAMFGKEQLQWLKNALLQSKSNGTINFRIIATGSQVLNHVSPYDCFCHYPAEYHELMAFIAEYDIPGIVFLTGDRHHSSVVKQERDGLYPLYDITASPLTSHTYPFNGRETNNPMRVLGIAMQQNYARISFSGNKKERKMLVEFIGLDSRVLGSWTVSATELSAHH